MITLALIRDIFEGERMARAMSFVMAVGGRAVVAFVIAAVALGAFTWWEQAFVDGMGDAVLVAAGVAVVAALLVARFLPASHQLASQHDEHEIVPAEA